MKKISLVFGLVILLSQQNSMAINVNATSLIMDARQVWVSPNIDCTNTIEVFNKGDTPNPTNFLVSPVIGSGEIPNNVYPCVVIRMRDRITFIPETTSGACIAGTEYSLDLCRTGSYTEGVDGARTQCVGTGNMMSNGGIENDVFLYLSTASGLQNNAFERPTGVGTVNGVNLTSPLVMDGLSKAKFIVDARGKVDPNGASTCDINAPKFGFQKL